jgi:hypothetical protein
MQLAWSMLEVAKLIFSRDRAANALDLAGAELSFRVQHLHRRARVEHRTADPAAADHVPAASFATRLLSCLL